MDRDRIRRLERYLFDKMAASGLPGLSVAMVEDGQVSHVRGMGLRELETGQPATPATLYSTGSVTKSFTALAVMQLVDRGQLNLHDPVTAYLAYPIESAAEPVRIEHLLSHTSGLPAMAYNEASIKHAHHSGGRWLPIADPRDILTLMDGAQSWVEAQPGRRWFYANEGYALLGLIIQEVSGQSYEEFVRDNILLPLGMDRSYFTQADVARDTDVAVPYLLRAGGAPAAGRYLYRKVRSEGGLISNVLDLSQYLKMYLGSGATVLPAEALATMFDPRVPIPLLDVNTGQPKSHYGYGLKIQHDFFGRRVIWHGGSVRVATAYLGFIPEEQVGVVILANGSGYPMSNFGEVALALLIGEEPDDLTFLQRERTLRSLTGSYESFAGTMKAIVRRESDFLTLSFDGDAPQDVTLVPERLEPPVYTFFTLSNGTRLDVEFRRSEAGMILIYERYKLLRKSP